MPSDKLLLHRRIQLAPRYAASYRQPGAATLLHRRHCATNKDYCSGLSYQSAAMPSHHDEPHASRTKLREEFSDFQQRDAEFSIIEYRAFDEDLLYLIARAQN